MSDDGRLLALGGVAGLAAAVALAQVGSRLRRVAPAPGPEPEPEWRVEFRQDQVPAVYWLEHLGNSWRVASKRFTKRFGSDSHWWSAERVGSSDAPTGYVLPARAVDRNSKGRGKIRYLAAGDPRLGTVHAWKTESKAKQAVEAYLGLRPHGSRLRSVPPEASKRFVPLEVQIRFGGERTTIWVDLDGRRIRTQDIGLWTHVALGERRILEAVLDKEHHYVVFYADWTEGGRRTEGGRATIEIVDPKARLGGETIYVEVDATRGRAPLLARPVAWFDALARRVANRQGAWFDAETGRPRRGSPLRRVAPKSVAPRRFVPLELTWSKGYWIVSVPSVPPKTVFSRNMPEREGLLSEAFWDLDTDRVAFFANDGFWTTATIELVDVLTGKTTFLRFPSNERGVVLPFSEDLSKLAELMEAITKGADWEPLRHGSFNRPSGSLLRRVAPAATEPEGDASLWPRLVSLAERAQRRQKFRPPSRRDVFAPILRDTIADLTTLASTGPHPFTVEQIYRWTMTLTPLGEASAAPIFVSDRGRHTWIVLYLLVWDTILRSGQVTKRDDRLDVNAICEGLLKHAVRIGGALGVPRWRESTEGGRFGFAQDLDRLRGGIERIPRVAAAPEVKEWVLVGMRTIADQLYRSEP